MANSLRHKAVRRNIVAKLDNRLQMEARKAAERSQRESFFNGGLCIVIERVGSLALIHRKDKPQSPYVVPVRHQPGDKEWEQGRYFGTYRAAKEFFDAEVVKREMGEK